MIKRGDPVKVRLHTGEAVAALYKSKAFTGKDHWVEINGRPAYACGEKPEAETEDDWASVRFVGSPCVLVPMEKQV